MSQNDTQAVLTSIENGLGLLVLNRPKALHSLDKEMCQLMVEALLAWRDDAQVKAIWITHLPETRGFCAGGDIRMLSESGQSDGKAAQDFFRLEYQLNHLLHSYEARFWQAGYCGDGRRHNGGRCWNFGAWALPFGN